MTLTEIKLFGSIEISRAGAAVTGFRSQKALALLAYLISEGRAITRDYLAGLVWPDSTQKQALGLLRRSLHNLNSQLPGLLDIHRRAIAFKPTVPVTVDVNRLAELATSPDVATWQEAADLYRAPFLEGVYLADCPVFEQWLITEQKRWQNQVDDLLARLIQTLIDQGEYRTALTYANRRLALAPWQEEIHQQVMRLLLYNGQRNAALAQYDQCVARLDDELGVDPSPETQALYEQIKQAEPYPPHNLPPSVMPFLGRETELAALTRLIAHPKQRLITLVGPGGMGKTRLVIAAAERQVGRPTETADPDSPTYAYFTHGIYLVSLAAVQTVSGLVPAITDALNFQLSADTQRTPKQQLLDYLHQKRLLLILDNFEQLLQPEAATETTGMLLEILQTALEVQILVTSRERLQVNGEQVYPIQGLAYAELDSIIETDQRDYPALTLFTQIAQHIQPDFRCEGQALISVAKICRILQGMPLAIELAAATINVLSPAEILNELANSLDLLSTTTRHIPARHRSIRAAFETSWQQLSPAEQSTFQKLSIFRGGFTREAAQAVANASRLVLAELVNKSFIQFRQETQRYEVHELMRQFGEAKLAENTDVVEVTRQRHSAFYCAFLDDRGEALKGANQKTALTDLELDLENARIGWRWAIEKSNWADVSRSMDGLCRFYEWRGRLPEGLETCYKLTKIIEDEFSSSTDGTRESLIALIRAKSLRWQGVFNWIAGDRELARETLDQSLGLLEKIQPAHKMMQLEKAIVLRYLSEERIELDYEQAKTRLEHSLTLCEQLEDQWEMANTLASLGKWAESRGHFPEAKRLLEKNRRIREHLHDQRGLAITLHWLGVIAGYEGRVGEGIRLLHQSEAIFQAMGDQVRSIRAFRDLAFTLWWQGSFAESITLMRRILPRSQDLGTSHHTNVITANLAIGLVMLGQYKEAYTHMTEHLAAIQAHKDQFALGNSYCCLAALAQVQHQYLEARDWAEKCVTTWRQTGLSMLANTALAFSSYILLSLKDFAQAKQQIHQILQASIEDRVFIPVITALPSVALLYAHQGDKELAIELYTLALKHPYIANSRWVDDVAGQSIQAVAETLPPEIVAAAQERGRQRDLWETAAELLGQFSEEQD